MLRSLIYSFLVLFLCAAFLPALDFSDSGGPIFVDPTDPAAPDLSHFGLSPCAAAVYQKESGFSIAGYGELLYEHYAGSDNSGEPSGRNQELGVVRGAAFLGYRFSDRLVANSELRLDRDLVDSSSAKFNVDSAYLEYRWSDAIGLRGGILLEPVGIINEFHSPEDFIGARRPSADIQVVPTNWHAAGFGIAGRYRFLGYRAYVTSGLNAAGFTVDGTREGRELSSDTLKNPAFVFRVDAELFRGGTLGLSRYEGNSVVAGDKPADFKVKTIVEEAHFVFHRAGVLIRAQYSKVGLTDEPELNAYLETTGQNGVGSRMVGGWVEGGYDFWADRKNGKRLMPYMRVEVVNPQDALPPAAIELGLEKNILVDVTTFTYGLEYRPIPPLVIKADYQRNHTENVDIGVNQFNINVGYVF